VEKTTIIAEKMKKKKKIPTTISPPKLALQPTSPNLVSSCCYSSSCLLLMLKQHIRLEKIPIHQFFPRMTHMVYVSYSRSQEEFYFFLFESNIVNFDKRNFEMGMTQNIFKALKKEMPLICDLCNIL
jgi:hypothetical protein